MSEKKHESDLLVRSARQYRNEILRHDEPFLKARSYLSCIACLLPLLREGQPVEILRADAGVLEGLKELATTDPAPIGESLEHKVDELRRSVVASPSEDRIPEEICDQLVDAVRYRLDIDFQFMYVERYAPEVPAAFLIWLQRLRKAVIGALDNVPAPTPVARQLETDSREFHIQGSPVFPWWDHRSDMEKAGDALDGLARLSGRGTEQTAMMTEETHWQLAPEAVRRWDDDYAGRLGEVTAARAMSRTRDHAPAAQPPGAEEYAYSLAADAPLTVATTTPGGRTRLLVTVEPVPGEDALSLVARPARRGDPSIGLDCGRLAVRFGNLLLGDKRNEFLDEWTVRIERSRLPEALLPSGGKASAAAVAQDVRTLIEEGVLSFSLGD